VTRGNQISAVQLLGINRNMLAKKMTDLQFNVGKVRRGS
jgi:DNA-binding protein Fis